jgi:hypothetical protein
MKIGSWALGLIVIIFIFGGIGVSSLLGYWQTESTKIPATYQTGELAGQYNPADIRGSYSFGEISKLFNVPLADLGTAFALDPAVNVAEFKAKDLETAYASMSLKVEVGTDSLRVFVALYNGLPYTLAETTYLPEAAAAILKAKANLTGEQAAFLDTHSVVISGLVKPATSPTPTETTAVNTVAGKTTFQQLLDWGVSQADIEAVIGDKLPATSLSLRDYATQKGLEFAVLQSALQAKVNAVKK